MMATIDEYEEGRADGYDDGLEDALTFVRRDADISPDTFLIIERAVRGAQGWPTCCSCKGTGQRALTERDYLISILVLAGARVSNVDDYCHQCGGVGFLSPQMARPRVKAA